MAVHEPALWNHGVAMSESPSLVCGRGARPTGPGVRGIMAVHGVAGRYRLKAKGYRRKATDELYRVV
jgi:hypothetical protein